MVMAHAETREGVEADNLTPDNSDAWLLILQNYYLSQKLYSHA